MASCAGSLSQETNREFVQSNECEAPEPISASEDEPAATLGDRYMVSHRAGLVVLAFASPVGAMVLKPDAALAMAKRLTKHAKRALGRRS